jgi:hypothetical protein
MDTHGDYDGRPGALDGDLAVSGPQAGLSRATGRRPVTSRRSGVLVAIGGAAGIVLSIAPFLLFLAYERSFVATATPDSGFNVFTVGAAACLLLAGTLVIVAFVMLTTRTVRVLGLAYLGGLLCGGAADLLLGFTTIR